MFDYAVVGCGLSGAVCARLLAEKGRRVIVIERRDHIAGNAYDYYNRDGILVHRYGPHIFHTKYKQVWDFLSRFTGWRYYQHRVLAFVNGMTVPLPINLDTVNQIYGTNYSSFTIRDFFSSAQEDIPVNNARDMVISKVGRELYELFFHNYTKKQWDLFPEELAAEVTARIPVRYNRDDRYFNDPYQGMPADGYTAMVSNMLNHPGISILLNTSYKKVKREISFARVIYTGAVDEFFDHTYGRLPYRSLTFDCETLDRECFQDAAVINYPNDYEFTRITEFKHLTGQKHHLTTIMREYPKADGEPCYPIPREESQDLYNRYADEAASLKDVYFTGRLGLYKYANMDIAVKDAIDLVAALEEGRLDIKKEEATGTVENSTENRLTH